MSVYTKKRDLPTYPEPPKKAYLISKRPLHRRYTPVTRVTDAPTYLSPAPNGHQRIPLPGREPRTRTAATTPARDLRASKAQIIQKKIGSARGCAQQMLFIAAAAVAVVGSAIGGAIYYYRNYYRKINISDNLGPALG